MLEHGRKPREKNTPLQDTLDSLLDEPSPAESGRSGVNESNPRKSPLDQLRDMFREELSPLVKTLADRYRAKGISIKMDDSDFQSGGRGLAIEISYGGDRLCLEGTVTPDAIAFHETRFFSRLPGTVAAGPMLRTRNLCEKVFGDFLYERTIVLVKAANRAPSH